MSERTEIVTVLRPAGVIPHPSRYSHTDVDGDRLLISTALFDDGTPGIYFRTDPNGSSVPLADLPGLIAQLQVIADASRDEAAASSVRECDRCDGTVRAVSIGDGCRCRINQDVPNCTCGKEADRD
ncbi:hypothetical protein [Streptomyces sp. NPDC048196]|uniref:hypothetical protein n=1 Tax=Streptomyces sp. NPDC048196 TaxID=3154712 RepID=UPI0033F146EF